MIANVTYLIDPGIISNINFYVPIMLGLALSPFIIWLITIFFVKSHKVRFFIDILSLIYTIFLMTVILPSFLGYSLTQIYQLITNISDSSLILQLYTTENILLGIYSMVSTFGLFYYAIGLILLISDSFLLWS
jgi:fructose-specific phosphotransferase system IIC component